VASSDRETDEGDENEKDVEYDVGSLKTTHRGSTVGAQCSDKQKDRNV
jgi:hypothetical protein